MRVGRANEFLSKPCVIRDSLILCRRIGYEHSAAWSIEDIGAAFVVKDSSGQKFGYFYYEEKPRAPLCHLLE